MGNKTTKTSTNLGEVTLSPPKADGMSELITPLVMNMLKIYSDHDNVASSASRIGDLSKAITPLVMDMILKNNQLSQGEYKAQIERLQKENSDLKYVISSLEKSLESAHNQRNYTFLLIIVVGCVLNQNLMNELIGYMKYLIIAFSDLSIWLFSIILGILSWLIVLCQLTLVAMILGAIGFSIIYGVAFLNSFDYHTFFYESKLLSSSFFFFCSLFSFLKYYYNPYPMVLSIGVVSLYCAFCIFFLPSKFFYSYTKVDYFFNVTRAFLILPICAYILIWVCNLPWVLDLVGR